MVRRPSGGVDMTTAAAFHRAWRQLPPRRLTDIVGDGTCLILAPHPDDDSLGCGGLIAACVAAGRPPTCGHDKIATG